MKWTLDEFFLVNLNVQSLASFQHRVLQPTKSLTSLGSTTFNQLHVAIPTLLATTHLVELV